MTKKERIKWIDVTKFLGIFAIYLGHLPSVKNTNFVFAYHVALFFFLSGCMNYYDKEKNILKYIKKKFKTIMIPFFAFSLLSIIIYWIRNDASLIQIKDLVIIVLKGNVRNTFIAGSLWFLSCLFLMEVIFKILKCLKSKWIIFIICLIAYIVSQKVIYPRPIVHPHWFYNLDSVLYYIIFFAIGYITYPHIVNLFKLDTVFKKVIFAITGCLSFIYTIYLFDGNNLMYTLFSKISILLVLAPVVTALIVIWLNLIISKLCENIMYFSKIGKETLYLCGNEFIIKTLAVCILELFSLGINLATPLHMYVYTIIILVISIEYLIPMEKKFVSKILDKK